MKTLKQVSIFLVAALMFVQGANIADAAVWVNGYTRSDGTYVRGHYRSEPNGLKYDNYSWSSGDSLYNDSYYSSGHSSNWYTPSYTWDSDYYTGYNYNQDYLDSSFDNTYAESYQPSTYSNLSHPSSYKTRYNSALAELYLDGSITSSQFLNLYKY